MVQEYTAFFMSQFIWGLVVENEGIWFGGRISRTITSSKKYKRQNHTCPILVCGFLSSLEMPYTRSSASSAEHSKTPSIAPKTALYSD